ncbi:hypothetical protein F5882DRAFT_499362 [Hyaloscypha sp. PMI_1271]|nr:hypothetical protein F5882DRAFT_499362 [Hyaloscypha sp. PMI_1271]
MDPLTALGLAGNIVQFVDFTSKLISTTQKLYDSSSGAKDEHLELENLARNIQEQAEHAKSRLGGVSGPAILSKEHGTILDLSDQCIEVSNQLLSLLESVKVKGQHRGWDSFHQALRSVWKKEDIKALQQRLDRISNHLNTRSLLNKQDDVATKIKLLTMQNRRLEASRTREIKDLGDGFDEIFNEIKKEGSRNRAALRQLSLATEKGLGYASEQALLEYIRFDTIEDRQIAVREAHHKTFSWIFRSSASEGSQSDVNFADWLASESNIFWISGKPGSGKSTLMKYICEHEDTREILERWAKAKGQQLFIANFFFWNSGRQALQSSQEGLLRSILYQILRQCPDLIPFATPSLSHGEDSSLQFDETLTMTKLLGAFQGISTHLAMAKVKFCFFIDGLDEYEGKPGDIIRLIELLKSTLQVKICVSSRPWNEFEKNFGQDKSKKLYMQDLTRGDIELYVRDILENDVGFQELRRRDSHCLDLIQDVVDAAKGVFLWVFLVVRSLLEGLTNADRIVDLQRRLRLLPTDLNGYFERILFTVDNFYRKQTAQMFRVTLAAYNTLPSLCYWFIDQEDPSLMERLEVGPLSKEVTSDRLKQIQKRLNACCKGLLEAQTMRSMYLRVEFLHRTVRDFLLLPEMQQMLDKRAGEGFDANVAICEATVCLVKTAPQHVAHFRPFGSISKLLVNFFYHISVLEDTKYPITIEVRLLDELDKALKKHSEVVDTACSVLSGRLKWEPDSDVLDAAVVFGLHRYVSVKLDRHSLSTSRQANLLLTALLSAEEHKNRIPPTQMVSLLLQRGFDPNLPFNQEIGHMNATVWKFFLVQQWKGRNIGKFFHLTKDLLMHGADINASVIIHKKFTAAELVKLLLSADEARELEPFLNPRPKEVQRARGHESRRKRFIKSVFGRREGK